MTDGAGTGWAGDARRRLEGQCDESHPGLGTIILKTMADRLDASMEVEMDMDGRMVSVSHGAAFASRRAAADPVWRLDSRAGAPGRTKPVDATPEDGS